MTWFTGIVVFTLIWWTVLFAVLPIGVQPDSEGDVAAGGWRGAPRNPRIGRKLLLTTLISLICFAAAFALIESDWISFRRLTPS